MIEATHSLFLVYERDNDGRVLAMNDTLSPRALLLHNLWEASLDLRQSCYAH